jgi:hypothetical protein
LFIDDPDLFNERLREWEDFGASWPVWSAAAADIRAERADMGDLWPLLAYVLTEVPGEDGDWSGGHEFGSKWWYLMLTLASAANVRSELATGAPAPRTEDDPGCRRPDPSRRVGGA